MKWDSTMWNAELDEDANEIRIAIEAACEDMPDATFQRLQNGGIEVKSISLRPDKPNRMARRPT